MQHDHNLVKEYVAQISALATKAQWKGEDVDEQIANVINAAKNKFSEWHHQPAIVNMKAFKHELIHLAERNGGQDTYKETVLNALAML